MEENGFGPVLIAVFIQICIFNKLSINNLQWLSNVEGRENVVVTTKTKNLNLYGRKKTGPRQ